MGFKHLTSRDNAVFKYFKKIADSSRERNKASLTLLDGVHLIEAYCHVFGEPETLIIPEGKSSAEATALMQQLQDINTVMLPTLMFGELTPVASSTGILALVKTSQLLMPASANFALMLEDIQDPGNLGSMLRTAVAAGVNAVYLSKGCADAWSPKALRGGQGAQFVLPLMQGVDLINTLEIFEGNSFALTMQGESLYQQDLTGQCMFVLGNEGAGLSADVLKVVKQQVTIPMENTHSQAIESLNVAAANAITLFECKRQKSIVSQKINHSND